MGKKKTGLLLLACEQNWKLSVNALTGSIRHMLAQLPKPLKIESLDLDNPHVLLKTLRTLRQVVMLTPLSDPLNLESLDLDNPHVLLKTLRTLRQMVATEGQATFEQWRDRIIRPEFLPSALNLAHYLALRRRDLRGLQTALMPWGLSSLGRIESRVIPNLDAAIATLSRVCHPQHSPTPGRSPIDPNTFFEGDRLLGQHTQALFGQPLSQRRVRILVTLPTEAASQYEFVREIVKRGADAVRINCAHDTATQWQAMIQHVRQAEAETGQSCKVLMDLAGPKPRTGSIITPDDRHRLQLGDRILVRSPNAIPLDPSSFDGFQTTCSIPEILDQLQVGASVWIDDGKIGTSAIATQVPLPNNQRGILLAVTQVPPKGAKLHADKGLNFPDTVLHLSPLTCKDYQDLEIVASQADIVSYSFVQTADDIALLQQALAQCLPPDAPLPAIVAKIETPEAVRNLPELIVQAAGLQSFGVMIARGDLAVEIGYQRLAEIQEEILWICEAAHVPVIWATQVLESLVKRGIPSRGEMTDAAMAERAECVMLNKGPFVAEAVTILDDVLTRMQAHQLKKTPRLRALRSWSY